MIPVYFNDVIRRKPLSSRRDSSRLRRSRRFAPLPEPLEARLTLTANIAITSASVVNSSGSPINSVNIGESVDILANYTTSNLPSGASYTINFEVNGLILATGSLTSGAGTSGTTSFSYNSHTAADDFTTTPGSNQVIVVIDPANSVAESTYSDNSYSFNFTATAPVVGGLSYTAAEMRQAYGITSIPNFGSATPDGTGQTIAIVDAFNDPTCVTDLNGFDQDMALSTTSSESLYQAYGAASSFFSVFNQSGSNITANVASSGSNGVPEVDSGWDGEITLDIEWAHSIAPGAKIDLIEANTASDLNTAEIAAAKLPGVSVVSNSWGGGESSGDSSSNSVFTTPTGHTGVTFLAATGDSGAPGGYPAYSPNVVAIGGTQLTLSSNAYGSETTWSFPTPDQTLNNGGSSYSQSGSWTSASGGFSSGYSVAAGGTNAQATWTTSGVTGTVELSTTWIANAANATNATYTVYDGSASSGNILGTVSVNQAKAAVGTPDGSSQFVYLGDFSPDSGTLTVVLNASSANGKVVADAIGVADASADGGGISQFQKEPSYQLGVQTTGFRTIPDVSFDASVNSGVDFYENGSLDYGIAGTSLACPCWSGLIAIVNQDRVSEGGQVLDSATNPTQTQLGLYSIPSSDYHDITTGYNGFAAGIGYDEATGLGTPIANLLVPALAAFQNINNLVITSQPPATIPAGSSFSLTVTVESSLGAKISTYNGPVTIALGNDPGQGILGGTLTVNAVNGVATFSGLTLDTEANGYTIVTTGTKLTSATSSSFNVIAGSPSQILFSSQPPSSVTAGTAFGLAVTVEDVYGNIVTADTGSLIVALGTNPGTASLGGTSTVSIVNGVATFSGLTLTQADAGYVLSVSGTGLGTVTTNPITVTPASPATMILIQAPQSAVAGTPFGLELAIEDMYGNLETGDNTAVVSASLLVGAGPLVGTTSVTESNGIVNFSNLTDDKAVTVALSFTSTGLNQVITGNLVISPSSPTQFVIKDQPSASVISGEPFPLQPLIYEEDAFGNLVTSDSSSMVTVSLISGTGPLMGTTTIPLSNGAARFLNLQDNKGETIKLKFTGNLPTVISNSVVVTKLVPTIALGAVASTATYGQSTSFTATLTAASGGTIPTGSVEFLTNGTVLGSAPINSSGQATFSTTALTLGTQAITAVYTGDPVNAPVNSSAGSIRVSDLVNDNFDGSGKSSFAVFGYNPTYGKYGYTVLTAASNFTKSVFFDNNGYGYGNATSIPVAGDYFGDGQDAYALWTPNSLGGMTFTAISSVTGKSVSANFGGVNDIPVVADIQGNGKDDFGVYGYQPGYGYCFDFLLASDNFSVNAQYIFNNNGYGYGNASSIPVVADFDGSGKAGFGVYTPLSTGGATFAFVDPSTNTSFIKTLSASQTTGQDIPMAVDYDSTGKASLALYGPDPSDPSEYRYLVLTASSGLNPSQAVTFNNNGYGYGNSTSVAVMADYSGTGLDDFADYTPSSTGGMVFVFQTDQTGPGVSINFGTFTEIAVEGSTYIIAKKVRSL
jgi:hypothetical protein